MNKQERMASIRAGEDTELELKEIVFRGNRISFAREEGSSYVQTRRGIRQHGEYKRGRDCDGRAR